MSAYPLVLDGEAIDAIVVGGGKVATRKALALLDAGARVHVVSPAISEALQAAEGARAGLRVTRDRYSSSHLGSATLVVAATDDAQTNAAVAADARAGGRLVNVASAPELGNCVTPAVHRAGDVVVAVSTGRVPNAAVRIRDAIAGTVDARYASAVRELSTLRRTLLAGGDGTRWSAAAAALVGADFCEQVESGAFDARLGEWR
ncbi:MAG: precorrin-2 dehydrogenase [Gemmatimonadetes bacterium]|nr:precorrin-2 dehydrogenase [Gemmatimonadota bacterium]